MLICNNQLDATQMSALEDLADLCKKADGDLPPMYYHILEQKRISNNNFLYFEKDKLIGFLSVYFFYTDACEVSLIVDPKHRRKGIAKKLLLAALPLIEEKEIAKLLFSTPANAHESWLSSFGFTYENSEHHMERSSFEPVLINKRSLVLHKATEKDIPELCAIDELCFPVDPENMPLRFINILSENEYTIMLAKLNNKAVAKAHIRWQSDKVIFSDIAVMPQYQHRGLGGELLANLINTALILGKTKLALDVETTNLNALKLYTRYDFKSVNSIDFWAISQDKLRLLLQS